MQFCKNCGKQLNDEVRFCDGCGTGVSGVSFNQTSNNAVANFTIWDGFISYWKNYTNFSGRARRTEYWGCISVSQHYIESYYISI